MGCPRARRLQDRSIRGLLRALDLLPQHVTICEARTCRGVAASRQVSQVRNGACWTGPPSSRRSTGQAKKRDRPAAAGAGVSYSLSRSPIRRSSSSCWRRSSAVDFLDEVSPGPWPEPTAWPCAWPPLRVAAHHPDHHQRAGEDEGDEEQLSYDCRRSVGGRFASFTATWTVAARAATQKIIMKLIQAQSHPLIQACITGLLSLLAKCPPPLRSRHRGHRHT